ncbi:MAG: DNA mismatch repair protein MutL, partial [Planctomycetota bacterium]
AHATTDEASRQAATQGHDREAARQHRQATLQWARGDTESPDFSSSGAPAAKSPSASVPPFRPFGSESGPQSHAHSAAPSTSGPPSATVSESREQAGLQIHDRYLVAESADGLVVIDQHALHERILYEQLRERVLNGALESQRLLVPEPVTLTGAEAGAILEARDLLAQLGIEVDAFGGDTMLVSSYPAMLANLKPGEVLRQVVEQLVANDRSPDRRDLLDELLHMISCKAAVKAGDRLSGDEVTALLQQRHCFHDTHHCPHGRPAALLFTKEELEKRFKRV